jgi:hypothetical protein
MTKLTLSPESLEVSSFEPEAAEKADRKDGEANAMELFDPFTHPRVTCLVRCPG